MTKENISINKDTNYLKKKKYKGKITPMEKEKKNKDYRRSQN